VGEAGGEGLPGRGSLGSGDGKAFFAVGPDAEPSKASSEPGREKYQAAVITAVITARPANHMDKDRFKVDTVLSHGQRIGGTARDPFRISQLVNL
jgi:hypothetical protein